MSMVVPTRGGIEEGVIQIWFYGYTERDEVRIITDLKYIINLSMTRIPQLGPLVGECLRYVVVPKRRWISRKYENVR